MALSTYEDIWRGVLLRCPAASVFLARQWTSYAFRQIYERRRWSWLVKRGQFILPQLTNAGTVTCTLGQTNVTGVGTGWTSAIVGQQFRLGTQTPIYTVLAFNSATSLTLSEPWGGQTTANAGYRIYQAYVTVPTDFHAFVSVWDPRFNWQLHLNVAQEELNSMDAQRANTGTAWVLSPYAYDLFNSPPLPRYEIWPHQTAQYVYPFLYESRPPDLEDPGATLPRYIRGDVLLTMALAEAARWPGADSENPNPYFNLNLAMQHDVRAEKMINTMEVQDDEVSESDLRYSSYLNLPFAALPLGDSAWIQTHGI